MSFQWKKIEDNTSPIVRAVRIVLLILIIIGIGLLFTQDKWVPVLVQYLL